MNISRRKYLVGLSQPLSRDYHSRQGSGAMETRLILHYEDRAGGNVIEKRQGTCPMITGNGKFSLHTENACSTRKTTGKLGQPCGDLLADTCTYNRQVDYSCVASSVYFTKYPSIASIFTEIFYRI